MQSLVSPFSDGLASLSSTMSMTTTTATTPMNSPLPPPPPPPLPPIQSATSLTAPISWIPVPIISSSSSLIESTRVPTLDPSLSTATTTTLGPAIIHLAMDSTISAPISAPLSDSGSNSLSTFISASIPAAADPIPLSVTSSSSSSSSAPISNLANTQTSLAGKPLSWYKNLPTVVEFSGGEQSQEVLLLEHSVVCKRYNPKSATHKKKFWTEVSNLRHLEKCEFVPKLLCVDEKQCVIYMTYCGKRVKTLTKEIKAQVSGKIRVLYEQWKMQRRDHPDVSYMPRRRNITTMNNQIYLIDMGPPWIALARLPVVVSAPAPAAPASASASASAPVVSPTPTVPPTTAVVIPAPTPTPPSTPVAAPLQGSVIVVPVVPTLAKIQHKAKPNRFNVYLNKTAASTAAFKKRK